MLNDEKQQQSRPAPAGVALDHVGVMVPDMDEGIRWYTAFLGFELRDRWANDDIGMEWAHLGLGGSTLELVKRPGLETAPSGSAGYHHIALVVDDCGATVRDLESRGVGVMFPPSYFDRHDMDWAFVTDVFGNVIEILSYRSRRPN
jgi:catechol 2,3-dioxygenase-like lactoylglutathione lyase family enzyme